MENLKKTTAERVNVVENGKDIVRLKLGGGYMGRSLVALNRKSGTIYNVVAKCRNTDKVSIVKSLSKAYLAVEREKELENAHKDVQRSGKVVSNRISPVLSCHVLYVTDKDGNILADSGVEVKGGGTLREVLRYSKSAALYNDVVYCGKSWDDPMVSSLLQDWCTAAIRQMDFAEKCDLALLKAANSTEKEQKAAEKAAAEKAPADTKTA